MNKTQEQLDIIEAVKSGQDLIIQAYAGAAKTTTLRFIAEELSNKNILYIAFNKAIVEEATKKMPDNVTVKTIHAVAYANCQQELLQRLKYTKKIDVPAISNICKLSGMTLYNIYTKQDEFFNSYRVASWVLKVVNSFMHSSRKDIHMDDVYIGNEYQHLCLKDNDKLILAQAAKKVWEYYKYDSQYHITHDVYLKVFGMSGIDLKYDVILVDECQDVSGIMLSFLKSQINTQKIYVGDQFQKIYSFTGSIDITSHLPHVKRYTLTKTFRFGENISQYANQWINELIPNSPKLIGTESIFNDITTRAILCRTNASVIEEYLKLINSNPNLKCNISCDITAIINFLTAIKELDENNSTKYPILSYFNTVKEFYTWADNNDFMLETELLQNIKLSKKFNYKTILPILNNYKTHRNPNIEISTVHKAKGLEWDEITLANDFKFKHKEDLRIFYVAITRAKFKLENYNLYDITNRSLEQMRIDIGDLDPNKNSKTFIPIPIKNKPHRTSKFNKSKKY